MSKDYYEAAAEHLARHRGYHLMKMIEAAEAVVTSWAKLETDAEIGVHVDLLSDAIEEAKK